MDFEVYLSIQGQIHRQIKDLLPGTKITGFTVGGEAPNHHPLGWACMTVVRLNLNQSGSAADRRCCRAVFGHTRRGDMHDVRVAELTPRLRRRIRRDFPAGSAEKVIGYLEGLTDSALDGQHRERVQAAVVIASRGQWDRFKSMLKLLGLDWRDVLMAGGLGADDWRLVLDSELGACGD